MSKDFVTRAYNDIKKFPEKGFIVKSSDNEKLADEINYFKNIPEEFKRFFPVFINTSETTRSESFDYQLKLEYLPHRNLGEKLFEEFDEVFWEKCASQIFNILKTFQTKNRYLDRRSIIADLSCKMFIDKTEKEYSSLEEAEGFDFLKYTKNISINGGSYKTFREIKDKVFQSVKEIDFSDSDFSFIHGDFCFANILFHQNLDGDIFLKLVDPRGSYGGEIGCYGNRLYDLAKIFHSVEGGYEYIINDKFTLTNSPIHCSGGKSRDIEINFSFENDVRPSLSQIFYNHTKEKDKRLIKLVQGLIFIGMCNRHYDSYERQTIMYCTGVKLLNEYLDL